MTAHITDAELVGVTEHSITVAFAVDGPDGVTARVVAAGRAHVAEPGAGPHLVRIDGLEPGTDYELAIEADGAEPAAHDALFPPRATTLPAPRAEQVASLGTVSDLHFGETRFGFLGTPGDELPADAGAPYPQLMSDSAVEAMNACAVDLAIVKGDIADHGTAEELAAAAASFAGFAMPWHALLGNHDYYAINNGGEAVDGYAALGQDAPPRRVDVATWTLLLVDSSIPGEHRGQMTEESLAFLAAALAECAPRPTLVITHHQPVPPEWADSGPINAIGIRPDDTVRLWATLAGHSHLKGVLVGHTHRNRVRRYAQVPGVPFVEVCCTKDYPGGWGHYRLFADGTFRQEVRRIDAPAALAHSFRCGRMFDGRYRTFAIGSLADRCFVAG